jgi:hypothetical protein
MATATASRPRRRRTRKPDLRIALVRDGQILAIGARVPDGDMIDAVNDLHDAKIILIPSGDRLSQAAGRLRLQETDLAAGKAGAR